MKDRDTTKEILCERVECRLRQCSQHICRTDQSVKDMRDDPDCPGYVNGVEAAKDLGEKLADTVNSAFFQSISRMLRNQG